MIINTFNCVFLVLSSISKSINVTQKMEVKGGGGSGRDNVILLSGGGVGLDYVICEPGTVPTPRT